MQQQVCLQQSCALARRPSVLQRALNAATHTHHAPRHCVAVCRGLPHQQAAASDHSRSHVVLRAAARESSPGPGEDEAEEYVDIDEVAAEYADPPFDGRPHYCCCCCYCFWLDSSNTNEVAAVDDPGPFDVVGLPTSLHTSFVSLTCASACTPAGPSQRRAFGSGS